MGAMPLSVSWEDILLRLALTLLAGALIGFNRDEHGRPAGLRTTMLVCLAASVAMIQTNLLLSTTGKEPSSFAQFDVMRLPLGILSGMGFIGGGAILRRSNLVLGVTTAATLWAVTVIGLCFGGGQLVLGVLGTAIAYGVLAALRGLEGWFLRDRRAVMMLAREPTGPTAAELTIMLHGAGIRIAGEAIKYSNQGQYTESHFDLRWRGLRDDVSPPAFVSELAKRPGVRALEWRPQIIPGT